MKKEKCLFAAWAILCVTNLSLSIAMMLMAISPSAPLPIRIICLFAVWGMGWAYRELIARMEGQLESHRP